MYIISIIFISGEWLRNVESAEHFISVILSILLKFNIHSDAIFTGSYPIYWKIQGVHISKDVFQIINGQKKNLKLISYLIVNTVNAR